MTNTAVHIYTLRGLFHAAGIPGDVEEIPNLYWPNHPDYDEVRTPWLRVHTERGDIVIGWRKRVISIDWSESKIEKHGRDVVAQDPDIEITHGNNYCHAWGYEQAEACLRRLWAVES